MDCIVELAVELMDPGAPSAQMQGFRSAPSINQR